jgi:hypothetical protein
LCLRPAGSLPTATGGHREAARAQHLRQADAVFRIDAVSKAIAGRLIPAIERQR